MGLEDTTRTDARTETSDKPTSQERPSAPPPDNPGSPGQPSRLESLRRAREEQLAAAQQTRDTGTGSPPREDRDNKAATEQNGGGDEKAETSGKTEAEDQDRREDDDRPGTDQPGRPDKREQEPRSQDEGATDVRRPDSGTPGDRDRPQPQTAEQRADTRAEPADGPASSERRWTPPPDNPGSPGQPSRLESLARAREQQQAAAAQRTESGNDLASSTERNVEPASAESENGTDTAQAPAESADADREHGASQSEQGEFRRPDVDGEQPDPRDNGIQAGDQGRVGVPGDRDRTVEEAPGASTGTRAPDTGQPPGRDHEPLLQQDGSQPQPAERPTEQPPNSEQNHQDRPVQDGPPAEGPQPDVADGDPPGAPETQVDPADEPTGQNTEVTEPARDTGTHADDPGEPGTGDGPPSPEETDQLLGTQESRGEQDGDHGKKAEDTDAEPPPNETNETDQEGKTNPVLLDVHSDGQGKISFEHRYQPDNDANTERAPREANTTESDESAPFQGRTGIAFDSDGQPTPQRRDQGNDTADRGDPRNPEDDPASRDYRRNPDNPSRRLDLYRSIFDKPDDASKALDEYAKPAQKGLERVKPTGQASGARTEGDQIGPTDQSLKAGNAVLGVVSIAIIGTEAVRRGIGFIERLRRRQHADN